VIKGGNTEAEAQGELQWSTGGAASQSEVWPPLSPNEIFVECKWTSGMKI